MPDRPPTLLIVDDEPDVLESLRHFFRRQYRVLGASSGDAALAILAEEEVAVILSDQRMPGMPGDAFLARARQVRPDATRMLVTGYADIQAVINAVNEGRVFRYVLKPWDPAELEALVRQAAEQHALIVERNRLVDQLTAANADLRRANHDLAEANELKTAFLEVASHEFNTPITLVLGLSELLLLVNPDRDDDERELVAQIGAASRQLARLVARTTTVLRADDYRRTLRVEPTPLGPLLREVAGRVAPFIAARCQRFEVRVAPDLGVFEVDAARIDDAVLNLLTNAIKFTPDGGELEVSAGLVGPDEAEIVVLDRGIGLEPRALNQLFRPLFTQFDPSRHSSGEFGFGKRGLGLGLSIARQFVELHGGSVRAESRPGLGTRITVRLPRRPLASPAAPVE